MSTRSWKRGATALGLALAAIWLAPAQAQAVDDETPGLPLVELPEGRKAPPPEPDKPTLRREWQRQAWGKVTPEFRRNVFVEGRKHNSRKNVQGPRWVDVGPFGQKFGQNGSFTGFFTDSGRSRAILPHPHNPDIVYALSSGGSLWVTYDWNSPNTHWEPLGDHLPTTGGGAVSFGRNPNTIYLGLGDPFDQIQVGGSVAKSRNGGNTWERVVELGNAISVRDIKVDIADDKREVVLVGTDNGLYRSADEGLTYTPVAGFEGRAVWSIVRTRAGWLASSQPCTSGTLCGQETTLMLSTDRGATWAPISNTGGVFSGAGRTTLAVAVPGDPVVYAYASTVSDAQMRDVFRSSDGGQTWVANGVNSTKAPTNPVPGAMADMNICQSQCWYNQMVLVDPRDSSRNTLWIGGNLASARSLDGGATWTLMTWWLPGQVPTLPYAHADFHAGVFKMTGTPQLILGNDGGLAVADPSGTTWTTAKNNGLSNFLFYSITGSPKHPNLILAGAQDNGTRLRLKNDGIFNQVIGGDGMGAAYSVDNDNTVLGSAQGSSMRTNVSNSPPSVFQNWASATAGLSDVGFGFFTAIVPAPTGLDPTGRVFFHFSSSRVWRSNNGGLNWTRIASAVAPTSTGLPPNRRFRSSATNLSVSPSDLNTIAVGAAGGFLDITTDGGASWTDINLVAAVPGYQGFVQGVTWQNSQTLWITSVAQATGAARVIRASIPSPGAPWSSATFEVRQAGLPDVPVSRVVFDPRDPSGSTAYAATHLGVYGTTDNGRTWAPYGVGLPTVRVNDIYMPPDGGFIRAATYGRGIWEVSQLELVASRLTDSGRSCDADGILDNGETGTLSVTLANNGPNTISRAVMTVTSTNPHVSFPEGNTVEFPPLHKFDNTTGRIRVALNGATGVEAADFKVTLGAPELGAASSLSVTTSHRVNADEKPASSNIESAALANHGWTTGGGTPTSPNINPWQRRQFSTLRNLWWGPDNNGQFDGVRPDGPDEQWLMSPPLQVGGGELVISFLHRFSFENGRWDGGVLELSSDNGTTWSDIGTPLYNGTTIDVTSAPIGANRPAFVNRSTGWPNFVPAAVSLGTQLANRTVRLRFRVGADETTGAPGWELGDIKVDGLVNTPFGAVVPDAGLCAAR